MKEICAACSICDFMPPQTLPRELYHHDEDSPVLIIDDVLTNPAKSLMIAQYLLGEDVGFTFTSTIRCAYMPSKITREQAEVALQRCGVWTHQLTSGRALIITTQKGLSQMRVKRETKEGDMFKSVKWGVILCIPPLMMIEEHDLSAYRSKVQRLLKEVRVI